MHEDNYDTAEMMKRLQRQVSRLRAGDTDESVTLVQILTDETLCDDTLSASIDSNPGFAWSEDEWSFDRW